MVNIWKIEFSFETRWKHTYSMHTNTHTHTHTEDIFQDYVIGRHVQYYYTRHNGLLYYIWGRIEVVISRIQPPPHPFLLISKLNTIFWLLTSHYFISNTSAWWNIWVSNLSDSYTFIAIRYQHYRYFSFMHLNIYKLILYFVLKKSWSLNKFWLDHLPPPWKNVCVCWAAATYSLKIRTTRRRKIFTWRHFCHLENNICQKNIIVLIER